MSERIDLPQLMKYFEMLLGKANIGLDIIDSKFNIRYIDPVWKRVYGDPSGKKCYGYFMGRSTACPHCGVVKALRTKKIVITHEVLKREGNRPIKVVTVPFMDDKGEWMVAELNIDISDIRVKEDALRESELKYRRLFEGSIDAIFVADPRTSMLLDCNPKALRLTGYSRNEILSMNFARLHPRDARGEIKKHFRKMASGKPDFVDSVILTKDGRKVWVSISGVLIKIGDNKRLLGIFRDITERKKIEQILRRDRRELEKEVVKRSAELLRVRDGLNRSRRLAEIGSLAASVAHGLRTPLAAIRTAAYNIGMKSRNPSLKGNLANIEKKVIESDIIIKNLLLYGSLKRPQLQPVNICGIVQDCVDSTENIFGKDKAFIDLKCSCSKDLSIEADPIQLKDVFYNLINNSYESFISKKGRIAVALYSRKGSVVIRIKDNGCGIEKKDMKRLAEPFFSNKPMGTGLGLPVSKQIVDLHGGRMRIASVHGKGTTVTVSLPIQAKRAG